MCRLFPFFYDVASANETGLSLSYVYINAVVEVVAIAPGQTSSTKWKVVRGVRERTLD